MAQNRNQSTEVKYEQGERGSRWYGIPSARAQSDAKEMSTPKHTRNAQWSPHKHSSQMFSLFFMSCELFGAHFSICGQDPSTDPSTDFAGLRFLAHSIHPSQLYNTIRTTPSTYDLKYFPALWGASLLRQPSSVSSSTGWLPTPPPPMAASRSAPRNQNFTAAPSMRASEARSLCLRPWSMPQNLHGVF